MKIAITVDLERDIGFMDSYYGLDEGLPFLLDVLSNTNIKATFFINCEAIEHLHNNGFIDLLLRDSHEIASHGYHHYDYRMMSYNEIKNEICLSKRIIEEYTGKTVKGYRAPQFLINPDIIKAVKECGFLYDSSLPDVSGISAAKMRKVRIDERFINAFEETRIKEFQIDSIPFIKLPHGILWINFISFKIYKLLLSSIKKDLLIFYMHPFDLIEEKRRVNMNLKRKIFYLKNENGIKVLLKKILNFWISRGMKFVKLEDEL